MQSKSHNIIKDPILLRKCA